MIHITEIKQILRSLYKSKLLTAINVLGFALAGLLAMAIALLTVCWQSWRAATRKPVEILRYE